MIHDLIDPRKKANRNNASKNSKTLNENKPCDNLNIDYSDNEGKEAETSNTFIPPWLRNSLGLNQRGNQNLDWNLCLPNFNGLGHVISDQKSTRTTAPKQKEPNSNQLNDFKTSAEQETSSKRNHNDENFQKISETEIIEDQSQDVIPVDLNVKPIIPSRNYPYKELEEESVYMNAEKVLKNEDSKTTNAATITSPDSDKIKEERKKMKFIKQKKKIKKHVISDQSQDLDKSDVDFLLETNAREVLDNYVKKDVHSVSSDIKQLEAKLILINEKYQKADLSKLSHQEFRLLQEIKEQTGNRENFEKLMNHIKETNLREILKSTSNWTKLVAERNKAEFELNEKNGKESLQFFGVEENGSRIINDKDSVISTDDENDIKRFSEFLSKNKNLDEKKKCLEEVRNYFERKRRTRLTKRRFEDESKNSKQSSSYLPDKKDDLPRERPKSTDVTPVSSCKEKKNKISICEEEIVEKAVSETLQKFVNLYHFHVSPTMMGSLRKNILEAIQNDSYDTNQFKINLPFQNEKKKNVNESITSKSTLKNEETSKEMEQRNSNMPTIEKIENKDNLLLPLSKEGKKKSFKVVMDNSENQVQKSIAENDINDNESIKRLQKDFENCIKSIQSHTDVTKLRLQSVILEKKDHDSTSKGLQFVYNFTKKSLESVTKEVPEQKKKKDCETQVKIIQRSVKSQPSELFEKREKINQTDEISYATKNVQTDGKTLGIKEMKEIKGFDVTPGLYRLVKSKDVSRFYLYPENPDKSPYTSISNETDSSIFRCKDCDKKAEKAAIIEKSLGSERKSDKETRIIYRNRDRSRFFRTRRKSYMGNSSQKFHKKLFINAKSEDPLKCLYFENSINESQSVLGSISNTDKTMFYNDPIDIESVVNPSTNQHLGCFWFWNGEKINSGCDLKMHVESLVREKLKELVFPDFFSQQAPFLQNTCEASQENTENVSENISQLQGINCEKKSESKHKSALFYFKKNITPLTGSAPIITSGGSDFLDNKSNSKMEGAIDSEDLEKLESSINNKKFVKEVGTQNSLQVLSSLNLKKVKSRTKTSSSRSNKVRQKKKKNSVKALCEQKNDICTFKTVADFQEAIQKIKKAPLKNSLTWILELDSKADNKKQEHAGKIRNFFSLIDQEVQTNNILQLMQESLNKKPNQKSLSSLKHWELIEKVLNKVSQKEQETLWNDIREFIKEKIGRDINDEGAKEVCIEIEHDVPNSGSGKLNQAVVAKGHYKKNEGDIEVEVDLTLEDLEKILQRRQKKNRRRQLRYSGRTKNLFTTSSAQTYKEELAKYQKYINYQKFCALGGNLISEKEFKVSDRNKFT